MSVSINGSTGISGVDGSASAPALQGSDTNTGLSFGTDIVAINTGGSERLRVTDTGRVGIGTSSPGARLHVGTASLSGNWSGFFGDNLAGAIAPPAAYGLALGYNRSGGSGEANIAYGTGTGAGLGLIFASYDGTTYTNRVIFDGAGNVGIGTIAPGANLDLAGTTSRIRWDVNNAYTLQTHGNVAFSAFASSIQNAADYQFQIAGTERMRIDSAGTHSFFCTATTAGIMATSAGAGTSVVTFACRHSASSTTTGTNAMFVYSNGNLVNTNNSYGAISDIKLKENIVDANSQWDDLKALQVRNYNFKEGQTHTQIGLVAQEAELVSPGLVSESPDRDEEGNDLGTVTKSVNYSVLYMKAVKALQEAMTRIETLEAANTDLAARLTALEGGN